LHHNIENISVAFSLFAGSSFLSHPEVPATNNHCEREIGLVVLIRKIIYGNRSDEGALTQGVLMTVFRTSKQRGYYPLATLVAAQWDSVSVTYLPVSCYLHLTKLVCYNSLTHSESITMSPKK
ncbi:MAG: transposase, partial [bacterium]